jgi:hypothetical protein
MYEDYAFGSASMQGGQSPLVPANGASSRPHQELLDWLSAGYNRWLNSVRTLADDSELDREHLTNRGGRLPTRKTLQIMIAHDFYNAPGHKLRFPQNKYTQFVTERGISCRRDQPSLCLVAGY